MQRIGVLMNQAADNPEGRARFAAFTDELTKLGWTVGSNVRIEDRWGAGDPELYRRYAAELVALAPDSFTGTSGSYAWAGLGTTCRG
jgi:putative ABC transport system substrate-binding protein